MNFIAFWIGWLLEEILSWIISFDKFSLENFASEFSSLVKVGKLNSLVWILFGVSNLKANMPS